jgi:hypothetical protein
MVGVLLRYLSFYDKPYYLIRHWPLNPYPYRYIELVFLRCYSGVRPHLHYPKAILTGYQPYGCYDSEAISPDEK